MKWIWIFILLISCNQDEDMRMFMQSLPSGEALSTPVFPDLPVNGVRVLLITGQSNAQGAVPFDDLPASDLDTFSNIQIWFITNNQLEDLQLGINNKNKPYEDKHGVELGLAHQFVSPEPEPLYMIKHALGGTNIDSHLEASYSDEITDGTVWDAFRNDHVRRGINNLLAQGKRPFVYLYWCQGENDSFVSRVDDYERRFDSWVSMWKADLGADLPFIVCEIIETDSDDTTINNVFRDKALTEPNMRVIDTDGLPDKGDNLHYNTAAFETIASRCIGYMKELTPIEITAEL